MIIDELENISAILLIHPRFRDAFDFLARPGLTSLAFGRTNIDGDSMYALLNRAQGRPRAGAELETHERYIDIQYIIEGVENFGWSPAGDCSSVSKPYDSEKDVAFFSDEPQFFFPIRTGQFVVFFPDDAHMPGIADSVVHKAVVKLKIRTTGGHA
ncbi:MAG: YhcH/YjgK/YiaL family protein [Spirochaetota bacterium]